MNPPSIEELKCLPLRAIVAYAARWAERVRPVLVSSNSTLTDEQVSAVDAVIAAAQSYAQGANAPANSEQAMLMANEATDMAKAAVSAASRDDRSQVRYAAHTASLAGETLAQALSAFAPGEADDLLEASDAPEWVIDSAATMAHSAGYSGRFVLREVGIEDTAADDFAALLDQCAGQSDAIGDPLDVAGLGPLWRGAPPEWLK